MTTDSIRARRDQALRPRAVGALGDTVVAAFANWDRLELRDEAGRAVLTHEVVPDGDGLMHGFHFAADRWLVVGIGSGIMSTGFRVYDHVAGAWTHEVTERWSDVGVAAVASDRPALLLGDGAELARYGVDDGVEAWSVHAPDANAGAFEPSGSRVAVVGTEAIAVFDDSGAERSRGAWVGAEPTAIAWLPGGLLLTAAWEGELRLWDAESLEPVRSERLDAREIDGIVPSPDGRRAVCTSADGVARIVDVETLSWTREPDVVAAAFVGDRLVRLSESGIR